MDRPLPELGTQKETLGSRIIAWIIDAVIIALITYALATVLGGLSSVGGPTFGVAGLIAFAYFIYFEAEYGQTLGKNVMDIVVVKEDGSDCDWRASVIRNVLRVVDGFAFYLVGIVVIFLTDDNQRLGDILGDTIVVNTASEADPASR